MRTLHERGSNMLSCMKQTLREHREEPYIINEIQ